LNKHNVSKFDVSDFVEFASPSKGMKSTLERYQISRLLKLATVQTCGDFKLVDQNEERSKLGGTAA
jgi:hypothetical protein